MAIAVLLILLFGAAIRVRDGETSAGAVSAGVASFFLSVITAGILGIAVAWIGSLRSLGATWLAQPGPLLAAMWLIGIATAITCAIPLHARAEFDGLFIGHGLCWTAMSIALTTILPGGAYLALVPALAFALCTVLRAALDLSDAGSVIITSAVTAMLWFPIIPPLYDLVGRLALAITAAAVALVSTTFTPAVAANSPIRRASVAAMYTTAAVCVVMQLLLPAYTPDSPRHIDVQYIDDGGSPLWMVDGLTPQLRAVAPFSPPAHNMFEWIPRRVRVFTSPAPRLPLTPPELPSSATM